MRLSLLNGIQRFSFLRVYNEQTTGFDRLRRCPAALPAAGLDVNKLTRGINGLMGSKRIKMPDRGRSCWELPRRLAYPGRGMIA